jgi:hypothetical protein
MYKRKKAVIINLPAIAARLQELADRRGVGLTPHAVAVDRALAPKRTSSYPVGMSQRCR